MTAPPAPLRAVSPSAIGSLDGRRLLLLLHGRGADERDLLPVAAALRLDGAVIALRGPVPLDGGASWAEGTREEILGGAGLDAAADRVLAFLDALPSSGLGSPAEVVPLGFSQGGAVALTAARRAPGRFRRIVLLSGFVPKRPEAGDAALAADPPAVLWGRGAADGVIPPDAVERTSRWLAAHAAAVERVYPDLGHAVSAEELADVRDFLTGS